MYHRMRSYRFLWFDAVRTRYYGLQPALHGRGPALDLKQEVEYPAPVLEQGKPLESVHAMV